MDEGEWALVVGALQTAKRLASSFGDPDLAWDVGVDVLIRCARAWDRDRGVKFTTYAWGALVSSYRRELGRRARKPACIDFADEPEYVNGKVERETVESVQYVMGQLGPYDAMILRLRYWYGVSFRDLARVMGTGVGTAHGDVAKALARCRKILDLR